MLHPTIQQLLAEKIPPWEEDKSVPFPQADDVAKIVKALELYRGHVRTSFELAEALKFDPRQGDYYSNALVWLGYLRRDRRRFELTSAGFEFLALQSDVRSLALIRRLLGYPPIRMIVQRRLQHGACDRKEISEVLTERRPDIAGSTLPRRARTIEAWVEWIFQTAEAQMLDFRSRD